MNRKRAEAGLFVTLAAVLAMTGCGKRGPLTPADVAKRLTKASIQYQTIQTTPDGLFVLDLRYCEVADLSPFVDIPIASLNIAGNPVSDLSPLKGTPLRELFASETRITSIAPLAGIQLTTLQIDKTGVTDLSPAGTMALERLTASGCSGITSIDALSKTKIKELDIAGTQVTDLSPLESLPLESLRFSPSRITKGIQTVRKMASITQFGGDTFHMLKPEFFWLNYDRDVYNRKSQKEVFGGGNKSTDDLATP